MQAHRRRQGWLAWNTATLGRVADDSYPTLESMMGMPAPKVEQDDDALLFQVRKLKAFMSSGLKRSG